MPNAWSVDAQRLVPECPFDGQDRPLEGLWQNGLCNFIPQEVFEQVILHINQWSERKKYLINNEEYVHLVLNHLYKFEKQIGCPIW